MSNDKPCACSEAPKLIFSCSGAADVGAIADRAARKLSADGVGKMYCLTGIGGHLSGIIATTQAASAILAIDGCPLDCAKNCLQQAGFIEFAHLRITDQGMEKGKSPATDDNIAKVVELGADALNR